MIVKHIKLSLKGSDSSGPAWCCVVVDEGDSGGSFSATERHKVTIRHAQQLLRVKYNHKEKNAEEETAERQKIPERDRNGHKKMKNSSQRDKIKQKRNKTTTDKKMTTRQRGTKQQLT